jgi:hypothetical protein
MSTLFPAQAANGDFSAPGESSCVEPFLLDRVLPESVSFSQLQSSMVRSQQSSTQSRSRPLMPSPTWLRRFSIQHLRAPSRLSRQPPLSPLPLPLPCHRQRSLCRSTCLRPLPSPPGRRPCRSRLSMTCGGVAGVRARASSPPCLPRLFLSLLPPPTPLQSLRRLQSYQLQLQQPPCPHTPLVESLPLRPQPQHQRRPSPRSSSLHLDLHWNISPPSPLSPSLPPPPPPRCLLSLLSGQFRCQRSPSHKRNLSHSHSHSRIRNRNHPLARAPHRTLQLHRAGAGLLPRPLLPRQPRWPLHTPSRVQ